MCAVVGKALPSRNELPDSHPCLLRRWTKDLTGTIPADLADLTALSIIYLYKNRLKGSLPSSLHRLSDSLSDVQIAYNDLTGTLATEFGLLHKLKILDVAFNSFGGPIPTEVGLMTELAIFWASHNSLTGVLPTSLGMLSNLVSLNISHNQFFSKVPSELGQLDNLHEINLTENLFSGTIPERICSIPNLSSFQHDCSNSFCGCTCKCHSDSNTNATIQVWFCWTFLEKWFFLGFINSLVLFIKEDSWYFIFNINKW